MLLLRLFLTVVFVSFLETAFHRLSKYLEFRQKYSAAHRVFNSVLGVRTYHPDETLSLVFDCITRTTKLKHFGETFSRGVNRDMAPLRHTADIWFIDQVCQVKMAGY